MGWQRGKISEIDRDSLTGLLTPTNRQPWWRNGERIHFSFEPSHEALLLGFMTEYTEVEMWLEGKNALVFSVNRLPKEQNDK